MNSIFKVNLPPADLFQPPRKYSVSLKGHGTSISLEPLFLEHLHTIARRHCLPLTSLISLIDNLGMEDYDPRLTLSSKLRLYILWDLLTTASKEERVENESSTSP